MKITQKGFIVPILIIIVLIASGGFYFYLKNKPSQPKVNDSDKTMNTETESSSPKTKPVTIASPSVVVKNESSIKIDASQQNCGSMDSLSAYSITPNTESIKAVNCMSRALLLCSPATTAVTLGEKSLGSYKILGKEGSYCSVYGSILQTPEAKMPTIKTCAFSLDVITEVQQQAVVQGQSGKEFLFVPFAFLSGTFTNAKTGQKITLNCK